MNDVQNNVARDISPFQGKFHDIFSPEFDKTVTYYPFSIQSRSGQDMGAKRSVFDDEH